ncbi:hypothetical protein V8C35DRAFT_316929 [Trichoderma chlorosporum]
MDNADKQQIYGQDLDTPLSSVCTLISGKITDETVQWNELSRNIQECEDEALLSLTSSLEYFDRKIFKYDGPVIINLRHKGDLIPLHPCTGCSIFDGKKSHLLLEEKQYHLPRRNLQLRIPKDCFLYLLLLFESKEDRDGK